MILTVLRGIFIILVTTVACVYALTWQEGQQLNFPQVVTIVAVSVGAAALVVVIDLSTPRKKLSAISGVFVGLVAGLIAAYALSFVVSFIGVLTAPEVMVPQPQFSQADISRMDMEIDQMKDNTPEALQLKRDAEKKLGQVRHQWEDYRREVKARDSYMGLMEGVKVILGMIACYLCISLVLQTKGDFRFVLPYIEFPKQQRGQRSVVLDSSVIIDGRILDLLKSRFVQGNLIVPKFVLAELQTIADSADKLKRARGRRGLDILQKALTDRALGVSLDETEADGDTVDQQLLALAQHLGARLMTNDFNLAKVAAVRGVEVLNLNDLAASLKPVALPGEALRVKIVKPGEAASQGVGYLDDGTMVVVENARALIGQDIDLTVTSMLQTAAGRMIFGRYEGTTAPTPAEPPIAPVPPAASADAGPSTHGRNPRRG